MCKDKKILEDYFQEYRKNIIGNGATFSSSHKEVSLIYADWIAGGRFYAPIEDKIRNFVGPMVANTHSFSSETGKASTYAYHNARQIIKEHVNASEDDVLVTTGTGMTGALARLQRMMNIRWPDILKQKIDLTDKEKPVVFLTHMEHHSNHVPWMETIADVVIVPCDSNHLVSVENLEKLLMNYQDRPLKLGAFTACSNVTGIITPYHELAKVMHNHGGYCVIDFAASAPYSNIDMHPADKNARLDAVLFSPHKFLGGPGSCGILVFNKELYKSSIPDVPGGGNVKWTNPWGRFEYFDNIETKEDGGTPGFIQTIRAAMAIKLKERMGVNKIEEREKELLKICFNELGSIEGLTILGDTNVLRIGCVSFTIKNMHYNLAVRLLNDYFGIQVRGGWSCASTYSHYLFNINHSKSEKIIEDITSGNLTFKPGWVRLSLHPTMTNQELLFICDSIKKVIENFQEWEKDYNYNLKTNEFELTSGDGKLIDDVKELFNLKK